MRIIFVVDSKGIWGAERSLLGLATSIGASGNTVLFVLQCGSPLIDECRILGVPFTVLPGRGRRLSSLRRSGPLQILRLASTEIAAGIRIATRVGRECDVLVSFGLWATARSVIAAVLTARPLAIDLHDTHRGRLGAWLLLGACRFARVTIVPSRSVLESALPRPVQAVRVPRPVPTEWFNSSDGTIARTSLTSAPVVIGMFGQVIPEKRVDMALELAQGLEAARPGRYQLIICGFSASHEVSLYEQSIVRELATRGLRNVALLERVDSPRALMSACDIVVNLSFMEAFGRTVVEALACGALPIVTGTGPAEIVRESGIGMVAPASAADLTAAVMRADDEGLLSEARASGPARANALYSQRVVAEAYLRALKGS